MRRILFIAAGKMKNPSPGLFLGVLLCAKVQTTFLPQINLFISFFLQAFPSLKPRRQGRRGQVRYHYMRLQFVNLSTRPPKSMWENKSDVSEISDGSTRKRKRGRGTKKTASPPSMRGKVSAVGGGSAPISTPQATTNVTAEETFEEDTAIVSCEDPSQPTAPTYSAPCRGAPSEDEGDQSFYNELCEDLAALGQGSMPSFLQQLPLPSAYVGEWMTTIPSTTFPPLYDTTLPYLDFNNACHNTNNYYLNSAGGEDPPVSNLEEHLDASGRERQERETQHGHTTWVTFHSKTCCGYSTPCDQGSMAPTSS